MENEKNSKANSEFGNADIKAVLSAAVEDCIQYGLAAKNSEIAGFQETRFFKTDLPLKPSELSRVYDKAKKILLDQPQFLNQHKNFMGWSVGAGRDINMVSELLSATVNSSVQTEAQSTTQIEIELGRWMKQIFEWPQAGLAYMTSGTSQGNLICLLAARHRLNPKIKYEGLYGAKKMVVIGSDHTHLSVQRAMQMMGLGENAFRAAETERDGQLKAHSVVQILSELGEDEIPLCVVATLGSTVSGAFDSVTELKKVCEQNGIWLHVDGAWGAWAKLDHQRPHLTENIHLADSLAFDFHKWPGSTMGSGMVLFKPETDMKSLFEVTNPYLQSLSGAEWQFSEVGPDVTRPMRALAPWMLLQQYGFEILGQQMKENFDRAHELEEYLKSCPDIELPFETCSNTVVFRFKMAPEDLSRSDSTVRKLAQKMWKAGGVMPSFITWKSGLYLRFSLLHPAVTALDIRQLFDLICAFKDKELDGSI